MAMPLLQFAVSAAFIVAAGVVLTRCADAIADLTGFGRLLVGSILLAGATSLPELVVDISAIRLGQPDLAMGDLYGSSLFNLLILAILDLAHRRRTGMLSRQAAGHAMSASLSIVLTAIVSTGIILRPPGIAGFDPTVLVVLAAYMIGVRLVFIDQQLAAVAAGRMDQEVQLQRAEGLSLPTASVGFAAAAIVILIAGPFLAHAADELAEITGIGRTFVGTTLVALSTSLPEFVASLTALRMGAFDLAVGNCFGSNAFNMILFVPLDALHKGPLLSAVEQKHVLTGLGTMIVTSMAVMGQLYRSERRLWLIEPDASMLIVLILATLGLIYVA